MLSEKELKMIRIMKTVHKSHLYSNSFSRETRELIDFFTNTAWVGQTLELAKINKYGLRLVRDYYDTFDEQTLTQRLTQSNIIDRKRLEIGIMEFKKQLFYRWQKNLLLEKEEVKKKKHGVSIMPESACVFIKPTLLIKIKNFFCGMH